jgi:hypothetical protein
VVAPDSRRISRVPRYLGIPSSGRWVSSTGLSPSMDHRSREIRLPLGMVTDCWVLRPNQRLPQHRLHIAARLYRVIGLGCSRFARHYSGNRIRFLLLRLLRCFSSAAYLYPGYRFTRELHDRSCRVAPFGYLRIIGCLRLPEAFRRLLRPSSALSAKASTVCPS